MSENQIIEQVKQLILGPAFRAGQKGSNARVATATSTARRVVQGLGLHEERETWGDYGVALPGPTSVTYTRLVTDWQEDTK